MNFVTPIGFRDVISDEALVREELTYRVQRCFAEHGYKPIETPTLEVLDVMEAGGHVPASPFKLFDSRGDLLAMRPDVTMQIARMCATRITSFEPAVKLRYTQRVFREKTAEAAAREVTQMGVECLGEDGVEADADIISLFSEALSVTRLHNYRIALGSARILNELVSRCNMDAAWQDDVYRAFHTSNFVALANLTDTTQGNTPAIQALAQLPLLRGGKDALAKLRNVLKPLGCEEGIDELETLYDKLVERGMENIILIDFTVMSSFDYYTGIVFEAYEPGLGSPIGGGGRYNNLLAAYGGVAVPAAGFGFYLEQVMEAFSLEKQADDRPLRIAVPKGSLNEDAIAALDAAGLDVDGLADAGRTLMLRNGDVEYIIVRPTDAPIFVSLGAADCGICGEDSLVEAGVDVVELVDLEFGGCRFVVAESAGTNDKVEKRYRELGSIRIATKYPHIARSHFDKKGKQVEIVKLHGNIELAPITGMAEQIVDITATGTTLRENNLVVVEDVLASTARFFANPCSYRTNPRVAALAGALRAIDKEN
ncbi:ATP phosphoribosyltransferase [Anaerotardibacter muris]|uniref:ATP phosphoribosyltransferase n=1 Tax=Anaerotardibacter muris TaxID=2941505 RepID=UPI002042259C|nr:ATP phosphoribosyltransferase [Anaerotardibacter muris]